MHRDFASPVSPIVITTHHFNPDKLRTEKIAQKEKEKQQKARDQLQQMRFEI